MKIQAIKIYFYMLWRALINRKFKNLLWPSAIYGLVIHQHVKWDKGLWNNFGQGWKKFKPVKKTILKVGDRMSFTAIESGEKVIEFTKLSYSFTIEKFPGFDKVLELEGGKQTLESLYKKDEIDLNDGTLIINLLQRNRQLKVKLIRG